MPNGYTIDVFKGTDTELNDYVWRCARSFGALYLRDNESNLPLPVYYADELAKAHRRLAIAHTLDAVRAEALADEEYRSELQEVENHLTEKQEVQARYEKMLDDVLDWEPPSPDHKGLKTFMIEQLVESIRFDCAGTFYEDTVARVKAEGVLTGQQYIDREVERAQAAIDHYSKLVAEGQQRPRDEGRWVTTLPEDEVDVREGNEAVGAEQPRSHADS